jgi:hypothetical protein
MARLYANENFPLPVVEELRRLGHDLTTVQETGRGGQSMADEEVLALAVADGRAVLTFNRKHFVRLHRERPEHAGIVVCSVDNRFADLAARIHAAIVGSPDLSERLLRVDRRPD